MPTSFIKYTPDVEAADPRFDENLQTVIEKTERYIAQSVTTEGTGRAVRDAHAKGYGLVMGSSRYSTRSPPSTPRASTPRREGMTRSSASPTARLTPGPMLGSAARPDWR
jgi:hypothetical protein